MDTTRTLLAKALAAATAMVSICAWTPSSMGDPATLRSGGFLGDRPINAPFPAHEELFQEQPTAEDREEEPSHNAEKLGVAFTPPADAIVEERRNQGRDVLYLLDGADPPDWTITFQRIDSQRFGETAKTRIDGVVEGLKARNDSATVKSRKELGVRVEGGGVEDAFPSELVYFDVPFQEGDGGVSGLLVVQTSPSTFLYGTIFAQRQAFESGVEEALAVLIESLRIKPTLALRISDASRINEGIRVLEQFTPDVLRAVAEGNGEEFYRLYETDQSGTIREIGWQLVRTRAAPLSDMTGSGKDKPDSRELGLLVTIEGEIVSDYPNSNVTIDIIRKNWLSFDRMEERWSDHRTPRRTLSTDSRRIEKRVGSAVAETGIRTRPSPRSMITIIDSDGLQSTLDLPPMPQPFISQTELYILGYLIEEAGIDSFDVDWYMLDQSAERGSGIRKRSDKLTKSGAEGTPDYMVQTTAPNGSFSQVFSGIDGKRIYKKTPFGENEERVLVIEKFDSAELIEIYKSKNLPTR